jgi:hypothetical protein
MNLARSFVAGVKVCGLVSLFCVMVLPRVIHGAPCCMSATSFGVGRLLLWEDFAIGLQLSHARVFGEWTHDGHLRKNPSGYYEGVSSALPWGILRLHERIELQGWVPIIVNDRWSQQAQQTAGGLGDIGAASRFQLLAIGEYVGIPSLAVTLGGLAPTGRRVEQTSAPLFAGATGRGTWSGSVAIETEYAHLPWFVRFDAALAAFAPFTRRDTGQHQQYGRLVTAGFSAGREMLADRLVLALAALGEWQRSLELDDRRVPRSRAHLYTLAASLSWRSSPHLTWIGILSNSIWPDGLGSNRDARFAVNLGARYGYF